MYQNFMNELIMWNLIPQRKNTNHGKHVIHEKVFTYANNLPKYLSNMSEIINKITYIVYKEWLRALINEIKENNYDVNVLWKGNIACPEVLKNDFVSTIAWLWF
jgi:hypothetical protein